jgi:hypothetical protein
MLKSTDLILVVTALKYFRVLDEIERVTFEQLKPRLLFKNAL